MLVAVSKGEIVGHLQLVGAHLPGEVEIKNMAVRVDHRGRGIGRRLVRSAIALLVGEKVSNLRVATAAADIDNLRFYQRLGFRMRSIERDAFTPATGYAAGLRVGGIELRDRVWLDLSLSGETQGESRWGNALGGGLDRPVAADLEAAG